MESFYPDDAEELLNELQEKHGEKEAPECRICGDEMTIASSGPGGTKYHCKTASEKWKDEGMPFVDSEHREHMQKSETRIKYGDYRVRLVLDAIDALDEQNQEELLSKLETKLSEDLLERTDSS
jgi:hypothetical protein